MSMLRLLMDLLPLLQERSQILLIAPPAWGKTYRLIELIKKSQQKWVFLSPLRALNEEFYVKTLKSFRALNIRTHKEARDLAQISHHFDLIIITPELLSTKVIEALDDFIFVLDEFHLFYYWGDSFRERMHEVYIELCSRTIRQLLLTATMNGEFYARWDKESALNYEHRYVLDVGNRTLKNWPLSFEYYSFNRSHWLLDEFLFQVLFTKKSLLLFVAYRHEVDQWVEKLVHRGVYALGAKGGEVEVFRQKLAAKKPRVIISTTCLSHGVNLPSFDSVFIGYPTENKDFFIQMAARGGRQGERFRVYSQDRFFQQRKFLNQLRVVVRMMRNKLCLFLRT